MPAPLGMMRYNRIDLKIDHIRSWDTAPVYSDDRCDRLYLHHRIALECWWNPEATTSGDGKLGAESIADLRQELLRERRNLTITIGGVKVLQSPMPKTRDGNKFYSTDARNGPLPIRFSVLQVTGDKTVKGLFEIETWVPLFCERDLSEGERKQSVLSHRWEMSERIDELFLSTRTIKGKATFRTDVLLENGDAPDDFRERLFHPIPPFFKREMVSVTASSDGTSVDYSFDDKETPGVNLLGGTQGAIAKLRGIWRFGWTKPSGDWIDLDTLNANASRRVSVTIQAWGRRRTSRRELIAACVTGVQAYGFDDFNSPHLWQHMDLQVDLWDKFAQLDAGMMVDSAAINTAIMLMSPPTATGPIFDPQTGVIIKPGEITDGIIRQKALKAYFPISNAHFVLKNGKFPDAINNLTTVDDVPNVRPPASGGTRGSSLETMVAQVLLNQCGTPGVPVNTAERPARGF